MVIQRAFLIFIVFFNSVIASPNNKLFNNFFNGLMVNSISVSFIIFLICFIAMFFLGKIKYIRK